MNTPTRVTGAVQITRQDNVPDYGIPGSAWSETQLTPTTVIAAQPVDSRNFYGSVGYDFDKVEQESYTGRVEHDINSNLTLRNQARYNETHRTAVITAVQSPASFVPDSQTVTLARQGNERENTILSNQTSLAARFATGRLRHSANVGIEVASEEQFAPALDRPWRAQSREHLRSQSVRSCHRLCTRSAALPTPGAKRTPSASTRSTPSILATDGSSAAVFGGSTTTQSSRRPTRRAP